MTFHGNITCRENDNTKMPKYGNSAPDPQIFDFFLNLWIYRNIVIIRFQRAFSDFPILFQTQVMWIFVFWAQMVIQPQTPKFFIFLKTWNFQGLNNTLPTSSEPLSELGSNLIYNSLYFQYVGPENGRSINHVLL